MPRAITKDTILPVVFKLYLKNNLGTAITARRALQLEHIPLACFKEMCSLRPTRFEYVRAFADAIGQHAIKLYGKAADKELFLPIARFRGDQVQVAGEDLYPTHRLGDNHAE